jgi:hypothetical protein
MLREKGEGGDVDFIIKKTKVNALLLFLSKIDSLGLTKVCLVKFQKKC